MLEIGGKEKASELGRVPNHETVLIGAPRDDLVGDRVVDHVVRLEQERRWTTTAAGAGAGAGRGSLSPIHGGEASRSGMEFRVRVYRKWKPKAQKETRGWIDEESLKRVSW